MFILYTKVIDIVLLRTIFRGIGAYSPECLFIVRSAKVGGVGGSQPPLNFGGGVEPPLIFKKICVEIIKIRLFCVKFLKVGLF